MAHAYDPKFMAYADQSSRYAANRIGRLLIAALAPIDSVLDIGCAKGTWLDAWRELGVGTIQGVDGDYVERSQLVIAPENFRAWDLSRPLQLDRQFDLVQSLEVAEHIEPDAAHIFVENLTRHSRGLVLFSAAPPGQGGEFHVNEQPYEYWRAIFASLGFDAYDWVRPQIADDAAISFWYRYNVFLYVHAGRADGLPAAVKATRAAPGAPLRDRSPPLFRLRKGLVRMLPASLRDGLARFKANYLPSGRW
jgi:SAM-dependent methyltransferase